MNSSVVPTDRTTPAGQAPPAFEPDLYRLLGLIPFESDPAVISSKVRDLMREERKYQLGPFADRTQERMEILAAATACLLDPHRKRVYDDDLRRAYGMPPVSVTSTYAAPLEATTGPVVTPVIAARGSHGRLRAVTTMAVASFAAAVWLVLANTPAPAPTPAPALVSTPDDKPAGRGRTGGAAKSSSRPGSELSEAGPRGVTKHRAREAPHVRAAPTETLLSSEASKTTERAELPAGDDPITVAIRDSGLGTDDPEITGPDPAARVESSSNRGRTPVANSQGADPPKERPAMSPPRSVVVVRAPPRSNAKGASSRQKPPVEPALQLKPAEILRELRDVRLMRTSAQRLSKTPRALGIERVVQLVRYGRSAFANERRFQHQLDQEVLALKRVYPQLRNLLPGPVR